MGAEMTKTKVRMVDDVVDSYLCLEGQIGPTIKRLQEWQEQYGEFAWIDRVENSGYDNEGWHYELKVSRPEEPSERLVRLAKEKEVKDRQREWEMKQLATLKAKYENK